MRRAGVLVILLLLACAGAGPEPASTPSAGEAAPTAPATLRLQGPVSPPVVLSVGGAVSETPRVVAAGPKGVAVHVPLSPDGPPPDEGPETCAYPDLPVDAEGLLSAVVDLESRKAESFAVAGVLSARAPSCTTAEDRAKAEGAFNQAMSRLDLRPDKAPTWRAFAEGPEGTYTVALVGGVQAGIRIEHTSDAGYHRYQASLTGADTAAPFFTHEPNPAAGGSGELRPVGAIQTPAGAILLLEATHGPAGMWSDWVFLGPLKSAN